jgi:16S rRNA (uracil1498-N3)-methyltransferase
MSAAGDESVESLESAESAGDWRRTRPMVFVADLGNLELDPEDHHHLSRSLRVADGGEITVADGRGRWQRARLGRVAEPVDGVIVEDPPPPWDITIAFTPVKGQKPEWIVQKLTELGVSHIAPLSTERSVVRWDPSRSSRHLERWPRVIREAAMQSRQVRLPTFSPPCAYSDYVAANPEAVAADPAGSLPQRRLRHLMIGPEGGFSPPELDRVSLVSLPGGVLRAETAAIVAGAVLAGLRQVEYQSSD